jgi:hypothetical protein
VGCDIHSFTEVKVDGRWKFRCFGPFDDRDYGLFGFLAGVRNTHVPQIAECRGLPHATDPRSPDYSNDPDYHSHSWLTLAELVGYDYSRTFYDDWHKGSLITVGDFLGSDFKQNLDVLLSLGAEAADVRVVFCFDC